jgi:hypothetical protein
VPTSREVRGMHAFRRKGTAVVMAFVVIVLIAGAV